MGGIVEEKVISIINRLSYKNRDITGDCIINYDLPIDGDDADELINSIFEEFKTDFSKFNFHEYFNDEGIGLLPVFSFFRKQKKPLTVRHLIAVIERGAWFSEDSV